MARSVHTLLAALLAALAAAPAASGQEARAATGDLRVAVVRVGFVAGEKDIATDSTIRGVLTDAADSVDAAFAAQSDGAVRLRGLSTAAIDVYPIGGVPALAVPQPGCDGITTAVRDAASLALGGLASSYDRIIIAHPRLYDCTWAALNDPAGPWLWVNGEQNFTRRTISRELNRTLGAVAAGALTCRDGGQRVALSATCDAPDPAGDPFDVMGTGAGLMSAYQRAVTGLLPPAAQTTATSGDVTLTDAAAPGTSGTRLLLVPRSAAGAAVTGAFAISLRSPVAPFDTWSASKLLPLGVTVRLVGDTLASGPTQLLDMTPSTTSFADAQLGEQQTFTDPVSGVRLSVVSSDGAQAVVRIGGAPVVDTRPPVFATGALRAIVGASTVVATWPLAYDSGGVDHYELRRDGVTVATATTPMGIDAPPTGLGTAQYDVAAVDRAGNAGLLGATPVDLTAISGGVTFTPAVPVPTPAVVPRVSEPDAGPDKASLWVALPRLTDAGRGKLARSRIIKFRARGAGRIVVKVDRRTTKVGRGSTVSVRLTARQARRSTVVVVASRGTLQRTQRITLKVRKQRLAMR